MKPKKDPVLMLAEYWLSAEYMRLLTHDLKERWRESPETNWPKFRTYAAYWLSGLYVVAEGFKEWKLDREQVTELTNEHLKRLKKFRNGTFHYQRSRRKQVQFFQQGREWQALDWAEQLHAQLGKALRDHAMAAAP